MKPGPQLWERITALVTAVGIVGTAVYLLIRNEPFRDPNLVVLARAILSLAVALLGAVVPGFLNITWKLKGAAIRASGALALFVVTFLGTPKVLPNLDLGVDRLKSRMEELTQELARTRDEALAKSLTPEQKTQILAMLDKADRLTESWRSLSNQLNEISLGKPALVALFQQPKLEAKLATTVAEAQELVAGLKQVAAQNSSQPPYVPPVKSTDVTELPGRANAAGPSQGSSSTGPPESGNPINPPQGSNAPSPVQGTNAIGPAQPTNAPVPSQGTSATNLPHPTIATNLPQSTNGPGVGAPSRLRVLGEE